MATSGDIAVLQFGVDSKWHWKYLTPSALSTFSFNSSVATPILTGIGIATGNIPSIPIPLGCMDMTLATPVVFDSELKTVGLTTTLTNLALLSGTSGVPRKTAAATWTLDTSTFLTGNQTITLLGDATGSGATTISLLLATVASAGTYTGVTINAKGLVTSGTQISYNNAASLAIQTVAAAANGSQVSSTQVAHVAYTVPTSTTSTIGGASSVTVVLEICSTNSTTAANWITIATCQNSQTVTLAIALQVVQVLQQQLCGVIPIGFFRRLRSIITGTGSASTASGQEVLI